jgi:hypothetical protein
MSLSKTFIAAVTSSRIDKSLLACAAGIAPLTFSGWLSGDHSPRPGDRRVTLIGDLVGVSADQCFDVTERCQVAS